MNKAILLTKLASGRHSKTDVDILVAELTAYPVLVGALLEAVAIEDEEGTFNASWTLDHLLRLKLLYILPFIGQFCELLPKLRSESCLRSMAHICELLAIAQHKKTSHMRPMDITSQQWEIIATACFDWLIGNHKVATKVFAMTSLYYLGFRFSWIHKELQAYLEQTIAEGSTGYQNRAEKTLSKLKALT
ncbi:MAG: hypothetical protein KJO73_08885 [Croceitalea sp.]|nr:hypothetical protein [Croceitalea sp.]